MENQTSVKHFILLGFSGSPELEMILFLFFLILYICITGSNVLLITVVCMDIRLRKPMYFFLANFSGMEICYTSCFMPVMINNLIRRTQSISLVECMTQLYFTFSVGVAELFFLAVMAFDRYQAICNPLFYTLIMNIRFCFWLVISCWVCGFLSNFTPTIMIAQLDFCGHNIVNHYLCDGPAIIRLSCSDTSILDLFCFILALTSIIGSFLLTLLSYTRIVYTIVKIPTNTGKSKTFSTCSSHLTVAAMFYGTLIFTYVRPSSPIAHDMNKVISLFYSIIIPLLNPLIYSLRNKEVKSAINKVIC